MISKTYSFQEACEKGLLLSGDCVNIEGLYELNQEIVVEFTRYGSIKVRSLNEYFYEKELQKAKIKKESDKSIKVNLYKSYSTNDEASLASKLLTNDLYGIKASYEESKFKRDEWEFTITIDSNIIVRFKGEDETAFLELPPHVAYIC